MKDLKDSYNQLNDRQREAVYLTDGPLLVLAGPGTGKTFVLSVRAAHIIAQGKAAPENILILTYTNSAARAMKQRLGAIIGRSGYDVEVGTFHGFANSIIQQSEDAANYVGDKIQLTDVETTRAIEYIIDNTAGLEDIKPFRAPYIYLGELMKRISGLKKDGIAPSDLDKYIKQQKDDYLYMDQKYRKRLGALATVYRKYEEIKSGAAHKSIFDDRGRYDFDDMILFATEALNSEPSLKDEYVSQYRYVMVDEFQDTNGAQLKMLFALLDPKAPNLCCVGDDDQSIYRFQGASIGNFKTLSKRFSDLKTIRLAQNYRSSSELVELSKAIIDIIPPEERISDKSLKAAGRDGQKEILAREFTTEAEEMLYIVDKVRYFKERIETDPHLTEEERAHPYNNIGVLVRKRRDILKVIDAFLQAGIPYATDGKEDIGSEKRVRQLLDALELAHIDPKDREFRDTVLYKVISSDYFRIPQEDILRFIDYVAGRRKSPEGAGTTLLVELLDRFSLPKLPVGLKKPEMMRRAAGVIKRLLSDARSRSVHSVLTDFIKDAGIFKYILDEYSLNSILRIRQLRGLASFVNMVKSSDLANPAIRLDDFMLEMKTRREHGLHIQGSLVTLTQEGVRVYTAHGSKGLEFHSVIIPFCINKKNWPMQPSADKIQLPPGLFKTREAVKDIPRRRELALQDETRLFYVAATRARSNLIFTASPTENAISSQYLSRLDIEREVPQAPAAEEELLQKSLEVADASDPFAGTESVLGDMVANMSLNPTRLNTYITCPRRFLYNDVLKLPGPKKRSLVFGNCVHKALEETYKSYVASKKFPAFKFFRNAFTRELTFQGADSTMAGQCTGRLETLKCWYDTVSGSPVMPLGLEKKLLVTVGDNIIFTGKYDKVEWDDRRKKTVKIIDYKTGKPDDHLKAIDGASPIASEECDGYMRQLVCYRMLFEKDKKESRGRRVSCGELVFTEPVNADMRSAGYRKGQYVNKSVRISDEMVGELEELIKSVHAKIMALEFGKAAPERDKDKCGICDFDRICWRS